ncbi:alpha/beta fold hydrolase [Pseudomonas sp. Fl4BN1]|uniref:alpha/beta fold hydrolase n=1 Tax=Pseudomonas sp. Fl4BN1 TaxID=2697651 RepID=UPI001376EFE5|nr:alpha/beta hydrolase [Pseudomonas sp. Fl4BN1]NBF08032.1 alpha/beta hydrolase [Pseudomonas sp. Fl4BN1]
MDLTLSPTLILLPGMDGTGSLFEPLLQALDPAWPVQIVRYPSDQPLDYPALIARVMAQLPTDRPFVLLGESFSGPVAVSVAAKCPSGLMGLVLCSSFVCNPRPGLAPLSPLLKFLPLQRLPFWPMDALLLGGFSTPTLRTALAAAIAQVQPQVLQARLQAVIAVDVRQALATLELPLLYLRARRDRLVPSSASALVLHLRQDARVVAIDAPHCLLQAAPVEAALHLQQFMQRLLNTRAVASGGSSIGHPS